MPPRKRPAPAAAVDEEADEDGTPGTPSAKRTQSRQKQNEIRSKANAVTVRLRAHMEEIISRKEDAMDPKDQTLGRLLEENDTLHGLATTAAQSLLVTRAYAELTTYARRQATKLQTGLKNYDLASFVNKIKSQMAGETGAGAAGEAPAPLDFQSLGNSSWRSYRRVPAVDFMYGLADIQPRAPAVRKAPTGPRAGSRRAGVAARPENVVDKDKLDKTETDLQIEVMHGELQRRGAEGAPFYAFLVDPVSFSRSVENIFHSSFLIKDGRARLVMRGDVPTLVAKGVGAAVASLGSDAEVPMENDQTILRFDYDKWAEVKATYAIDACVFPSTER